MHRGVTALLEQMDGIIPFEDCAYSNWGALFCSIISFEDCTWTLGPIHPKSFAVDQSCYSGLLHKNISCVAPCPPA